jgi:hypothetical protein
MISSALRPSPNGQQPADTLRRKLRVGVIDLVTKSPNISLYGRVMHANLAGIMPQVVAVWCEEEGHDVQFVCYTGLENLVEELPDDLDLVIIGAFTQTAQMAYAMSNLFRSRGAVTVLGGPHARCYPQDAQKYFDYVLGFTDKAVIQSILSDCSPQRPEGMYISAKQQPSTLPTVRQRWRFIESTLKKAPLLKIVPMLGSMGCPYSCAFCIDSVVKYQPLDMKDISDDLSFLLTKMKRPRVAWHDPNFGVRFDYYMDAIEAAAPANRVDFLAESSLALLSEPHLQRMQKAGFKAILPGVESWYDMGGKSKTGASRGIDKVHQVAEHINMIMRYIPYIQTNFVLGMDVDEGDEPFELTKRFLDLAPGTFPGYSLLSSFGAAAPLNLEHQRDNRVLPFPFHFLNNNHAMNVRPKNYSWPDFYDQVVGLGKYSFSWPVIAKRFQANGAVTIPGAMNFLRAVSSEGFGRIKYHSEIRRRLDEDKELRAFFEQETTAVPTFYRDRVRHDLGELWQWLPEGALDHDANAYLKAHEATAVAREAEESTPVNVAMGRSAAE